MTTNRYNLGKTYKLSFDGEQGVIRFPVERTPSGKIDAAIAEFERAREAYYAAKYAEARKLNPPPGY